MALFSQKEKRIHYSQVADGSKAVKSGSKYSDTEQRAYARGQRDARNESRRICAYKNSTPEQRDAIVKSVRRKEPNIRELTEVIKNENQ